jgi:peptidoglycan lytic transglycosylase G
VNKIAEEKRKITPKLDPVQYKKIGEAKSLPPDGFEFKQRVPSLEGFLFPATYDFDEDTTTRQLIDKQFDAFIRAWSQLDLRYSKSKNLNSYDVLIIASMIEREVVVPRERRLVAAVVYNRLRARMPLQIDATLRYGLGIPPTEPITKEHLRSDSPYNTRIKTGLPPTPIANPGLASMQAAAHPAKVDYIYFVRKPDCRSHFFTASAAEFEAYTREGLQC